MSASRISTSLAAAVLGGGLLCASCRSLPANHAPTANVAPGDVEFLLPLSGPRSFLGLTLQDGEAFALKVKWQAESRVCGPGQTEFASFIGDEVQLDRAGSLPPILKGECRKHGSFIEHRSDAKGDVQQVSISRYRYDYQLADGRSGSLDFAVSIGSAGLVEAEVMRR
ncbi:MAG: hypothetical protein RL095_1290 [Verrucomicrobiota bacterium]|jgi:hypothetical protein